MENIDKVEVKNLYEIPNYIKYAKLTCDVKET